MINYLIKILPQNRDLNRDQNATFGTCGSYLIQNTWQFVAYRFTSLHMMNKWFLTDVNMISNAYKLPLLSKLTRRIPKSKGLLKIEMKLEENDTSTTQPRCLTAKNLHVYEPFDMEVLYQRPDKEMKIGFETSYLWTAAFLIFFYERIEDFDHSNSQTYLFRPLARVVSDAVFRHRCRSSRFGTLKHDGYKVRQDLWRGLEVGEMIVHNNPISKHESTVI